MVKFLTVKEAALSLQCSPGTVRDLIAAGRLAAVDLSPEASRRNYRISTVALEQLGNAPTPAKLDSQRSSSRPLPPVRSFIE